MSSFDEDTYETLATKTTQYSAKLLKKPDQCRAVCRASYLFWSKAGEEPFRNAKRVLECLQRALKIADACKANNAHVGLFVEILDAYLYHFEQVRGIAPQRLHLPWPSHLLYLPRRSRLGG